MTDQEIIDLEMKIMELTQSLNRERASMTPEPVPNYRFQTLDGEVSLLDFFGAHDRLLAIHNMGDGCRYCTLWADGFNGLLPHLESAMAVVLLSKDSPEHQRKFAGSRGWRFRLASHGGGDYIREQTVMPGVENMPGAVTYLRKDDQVFRWSRTIFGPGDAYTPMWNLLGLAGLGETEWTPQFRYWSRPEVLEDGGENLID